MIHRDSKGLLRGEGITPEKMLSLYLISLCLLIVFSAQRESENLKPALFSNTYAHCMGFSG